MVQSVIPAYAVPERRNSNARQSMQRLSIKHLQVLAAFRRTGSLSKIAESLKLTPSAVSHRIDEAEARLGIALFSKAGNRIRLTPAGEYILSAAERILADLERAETVAARLGSDVRQIVRLGMSTYRSFAWLPDFESALRRESPGIGLELVADLENNDLEALKAGLVDVVLTPFPYDYPSILRLPLFADELVALVAPSHRLARQRFLKPKDIEPEDYYTYSLAVTPGFEYVRFLQPAHARPRRYVIVPTPEANAAAAMSGQGLTVLSRWAVGAEIEEGKLVALPLDRQGLKITWSALLRSSDRGSSAPHQVARLLAAFFAGRAGQRKGTRRTGRH
jgi:LysR family transcriptional regulator, regulator for metE and metH